MAILGKISVMHAIETDIKVSTLSKFLQIIKVMQVSKDSHYQEWSISAIAQIRIIQ